MSVNLYLKDNVTGTVHEYGTNPHDSLILQGDGSLRYLNIQNMTGTGYPDEGYSFCDKGGTVYNPDSDDDPVDIGGNRERTADEMFAALSYKPLTENIYRKYLPSGNCFEIDLSDKTAVKKYYFGQWGKTAYDFKPDEIIACAQLIKEMQDA